MLLFFSLAAFHSHSLSSSHCCCCCSNAHLYLVAVENALCCLSLLIQLSTILHSLELFQFAFHKLNITNYSNRFFICLVGLFIFYFLSKCKCVCVCLSSVCICSTFSAASSINTACHFLIPCELIVCHLPHSALFFRHLQTISFHDQWNVCWCEMLLN